MKITPIILVTALSMAPGFLCAQQLDFKLAGEDVQVHGFASQGFAISGNNNFLTMDTNKGSFALTDFGVNISTRLTDKFRVGAQIYDGNLGALNNWKPQLDWAFGDYKFNSYFGVRAGKVKTPMGLFNDIQDIDSLYPWAFLPQSVYPADQRSFHLAHTGFVAYGAFQLPKKAGSISWQGYAGSRSQSQDEGLILTLREEGTELGHASGPTIGADVRWTTPLAGLFLGASYLKTDMKAPNAFRDNVAAPGVFKYTTQDFYAEFEKGRLKLDAEFNIEPSRDKFGSDEYTYNPSRIWYLMGSWQLTKKLSTGMYYSRDFGFDADNRDRTDPANYSKEFALNGRYDFNRHVYVKLEGHYIDGTANGFYAGTNPNGLDKVSKLFVAKIGYSF